MITDILYYLNQDSFKIPTKDASIMYALEEYKNANIPIPEDLSEVTYNNINYIELHLFILFSGYRQESQLFDCNQSTLMNFYTKIIK